ncbi:MAG TPA: DUF4406 domain-containing protein [Bryobacteraceae bacterium]|nr:DUF4406 domain-containing protein [Bryobacteraceae bacterium]
MPLNPADDQTIYIAGPMTGLPNYNFDAFNSTAAKLRHEGFHVLNPAETDGGSTAQSWGYYMRKALRMLVQADVVALLPGWRNSKGAQIEVYVARALDMPLVDAERLEPIKDTPEPCESILQEAQGLVHGNRGTAYGHPAEDYACNGRIWAALLTHWLENHHPGILTAPIPDIDPSVACLMMTGLKATRAVKTPSLRDSFTDGAGYFECAHMCTQYDPKSE